MKTPWVLLLSIPLLLPLRVTGDDAGPVTRPAVDTHAAMKQTPSTAKDVPVPVLEAKRKFADEKRVLDQKIQQVVVQYGADSPQAHQAKADARKMLAELRKEIEKARRSVKPR